MVLEFGEIKILAKFYVCFSMPFSLEKLRAPKYGQFYFYDIVVERRVYVF